MANQTSVTTTSRSYQSHRRHMTSSTNTVDIKGESQLCFAQDLSWFQGNIVSVRDDCNYSVYGEKIDSEPEDLISCSSSGRSSIGSISSSSTPYESDVEEDEAKASILCTSSPPNSKSYFDKFNNTPYSYQVFITDHFTGTIYTLKNVILNILPRNSNEGYNNLSLLTSDEFEINFEVNNVYKGQKADMIIQKTLGTTSLLGKGSTIYSGNMEIFLSDAESIDSGRSWSL